MKKRWILIAVVLGAVGGCNQPTVSEAREDAHRRWDRTRAMMLCGVADEHLKSGQLDQARAKAQQALVLDPACHRARTLLGKAHIERGDYALAVLELEKLCQDEPDSSEDAYLLGVALEKDGRQEDALKAYRQAFALDRRSLEPVMAAAEVLVAMGRLREAHLNLESYASLAKNEPGFFELAGRLATMQGLHARAAEHFQHASDLAPRNVHYRQAMGKAQFFAGRHDDAVETLKNLLSWPGYQAPAWVHAMLGDCYLVRDQLELARQAYQAASDASPSSPGVWVNLAKASLAMNDPAKAVLSASQSLQLDPRRADAALLLGYALLRSGQSRRAVGVLSQAVATHPDNAMLLCLLGRAHWATGEEVEALRCYSEALKRDPDNGLARELLAGAGKLSQAH